MAAIGTSGLSLALGLYNTQQISALREKLSSGDASAVSSVLTQKAVLAPEVVAPAATIATTAFKSASSSEVKELQERIAQLETFSSSVSSSSTANSSNMSQSVAGLSAQLSELELFANTASTQATTNATNIVMTNDEVDRLTTYTGEQITNLRASVTAVEDDVSTNESDIGLLETSVTDVQSGVTAANERIDALVSTSSSLETSLGTTNTSVAQSTSDISQMSKDLTALTLGVDALGDAVTLVDGNETDTRENLAALTSSWNDLKSKAYVSGDVLNAVNLRATNSNIALGFNDGQKYALHLGPITNSNWCLYASSPAGKGPDGKNPKAFDDVTKYAARLRLDGSANSGFIVENDTGTGVFSVSQQGFTRMSAGKIGDLSTATAFAHNTLLSSKYYAIKQQPNGYTYVNSYNSLNFCAKDKTKAYITSDGFRVVNQAGSPTSFGLVGTVTNDIRGDGQTRFIVGNSVKAAATSSGFLAGGYNVGSSFADLFKRVTAIEDSYISKNKRVRLRNHVQKVSGDKKRGYVGAHGWNIVCDKKLGENSTNFDIIQ